MKEKFFYFYQDKFINFSSAERFALGIIKHFIILCSTFKSMIHVQLICKI